MITFDGLESDYINADRLDRTVRLVPTDPLASCLHGELLISLDGARIRPVEVKAIFKVRTVDSSYSLLFSFGDTVGKVAMK